MLLLQKTIDGMTVIELVIVVMILGIFAGVVTPRMVRVADQASNEATVTQVLQIFQAAEIYKATNGDWPINSANRTFPSEFDGILEEKLFTTPTPVGGYYDWNGPGTGMPSYGIAIKPDNAKSETQIDAAADDGDLSTGWIRHHRGWLLFELAPK